MSNILSDIAAMAKAGYSPAELKEILTLAKGTPEASPEKPAEIPAKEQEQPEPEKAAEASKAPEPEKEEPDEKQKKIDELEAKIKKLEESNASKNNAGSIDKKPDPLIDLVRSYM